MLFCFFLYSLPLGSAYCLSISLKRILLIQDYTRSGTLHWFVAVALPYYIVIFCTLTGVNRKGARKQRHLLAKIPRMFSEILHP